MRRTLAKGLRLLASRLDPQPRRVIAADARKLHDLISAELGTRVMARGRMPGAGSSGRY